MKTAVAVGLLCILGLSACDHGRPVVAGRSRSAIADSLPEVVKSLPVRIVPSFDHQVLAWSSAGMTETYVAYNPRIAEKAPRDVLAFALLHEYGHLQLNHIRPLNFEEKSAAVTKRQELDADCFAAKFWAAYDPRVAQAAAQAFLSPAAIKSMGSERPSLEAGYPSASERAQAILDCLAEAQRTSAGENR